MSELSRRDLLTAAAACAVTPLPGARLSAAELKVDLSNERVWQPPAMFQPIVGTWRVVQDGPEKVIAVDGQPWKANQNNRTLLLAERARIVAGGTIHLYGLSLATIWTEFPCPDISTRESDTCR